MMNAVCALCACCVLLALFARRAPALALPGMVAAACLLLTALVAGCDGQTLLLVLLAPAVAALLPQKGGRG